MERSFGVSLDAAQVVSVIGTKELVASLPHLLRLKDPSRDTVLYPAVSYPTYAMGAQLGGCRAVPVPLGEGWHLDLSAISEEDAARALLLWVNEPGNPTGSQSAAGPLGEAVSWAQARGIVVASDECYVEFNWDKDGKFVPGATALQAGVDGVLAVHSLSKRSNMAGYRCGFLAGDGDLLRDDGPWPDPGRCHGRLGRRRPCRHTAGPLRRAAQLRPLPPGRSRPGRRRRPIGVLSLVPLSGSGRGRMGRHRPPR